MKLSDFTAKNVQGLYSHAHFEAVNGAYIQARVCGKEWTYRDATGKRTTVYSMAALKELVEG